MSHPLLSFGEDDRPPGLLLVPANGFPPGAYRPLIDLLQPERRVVSLPPRALWPEAPGPPAHPGDRAWAELAVDLLTGIQLHGLANLVVVGHSFGGVVSALAALADPTPFAALVLLDPTILPPTLFDTIRGERRDGETPRHPLAEGALRRRQSFASEAEAYLYFREKELFADWPETALGYYVASALTPSGTDGDLTLAWSRAWEAYYYRTIYTEIWTDLPRLDGLLPTLIVGGETSATFDRDSALLARRLLPHAVHDTLKGFGHLFPLAAPEPTAHLIRGWLRTLGR